MKKIFILPTSLDYYSVLIPVIKKLKTENIPIEIGHPEIENPIYLSSMPMNVHYPNNPKVIMIPHSLGGDPWQHYFNRQISHLLVSGEFWVRNWQNKISKYTQTKIIPIGWTKSDIFYNKSAREIRNEIRKERTLKLPYKKTLLYAPTGVAKGDSLNITSFEKSIKKIIYLSKKKEFNLIFKIKDVALWLKGRIYQEVWKISEKSKHITLIKRCDNIIKLFPFADVLLSDGSSTIREFYITKRPSLQFTNFEESRFKFPESHKTSLETLEKDLESAFNNPENFKISTTIIKDFFYKLDGKASQRAVKIIKEVLE